MKILVTGAAGFIGFHLSRNLCQSGHQVVGLDNINDYYDPDLKFARLRELGISQQQATEFHRLSNSGIHSNFRFIRMHLEDDQEQRQLFHDEQFEVVCHLAAQAGVRYSLENPDTYIQSNIVGFLNILENCRHHKVKHLVYASSSSVYGLNKKVPFSVEDRTDSPISLYAASKKSNELMAHTYSHLFGLRTTGLRFFTVYGPWGRPDMALFLFTDAIQQGKPIDVYNYGKMERDFTYVEDIVQGVLKIINSDLQEENYKIYNIGNNDSVNLMDFIKEIEYNLDKKAIKSFLPIQPGDVEKTWADVSQLKEDYSYSPKTSVKTGIAAFIKWYRSYFKFSNQ